MADIEHANLPDELLHEPKGASTATQGTVYVADGQGSGEFKHIELDNIDFGRTTLNYYDPFYTYVMSFIEGMTASTTSNRMDPVPNEESIPVEHTAQINKNFQELLSKLNHLIDTYKEVQKIVKENREAIRSITTALQEAGIAR